MAVLFDGASRLQAKLVPRESIGGEALYVQERRSKYGHSKV